jgi:hypothetical protein
MMRFKTAKEKMVETEGGIFDRGTKDISTDWGPLLKEFHSMV